MKVYKVVRERRGRHYSCIINVKNGGICYAEPGQPTVAPEGTKLLAFNTKARALTFADGPGSAREVWEAKAKGVKPVYQVADFWGSAKRRFLNFWGGTQMFKKPKKECDTSAPRGSVACDELTLVKKVS